MTPAVAEAPEAPGVQERPENKLLEVDPSKFQALSESRGRVNDALIKFNASNEDAKAKKKIYEAARAAFEREFDRFVQNVRGEDLPLFSQSEILDQAKRDPVVTKLVDRLLHHGFDVNALIVAGYTQDERAQASAYLDALDAGKAAHDAGDAVPVVDIPAFLTPQPLTPIEVAKLLEDLTASGLTLTAAQVSGLTQPQLFETRDFLLRTAAVHADKGEAVTFEDLPAVPTFLKDLEDQGGEAPESEDADADDANRDPNVH